MTNDAVSVTGADPDQITYNPVYDVTYIGADPTRGHVYTRLSAIAPGGAASVELRPELMAFAQLMETQLQANDRKPGWKQDEGRDLMGRLYDEALELYDAVASQSIGAGPAEIVGKEAADVANFAMMIADVCGALPTLATSSPVDAEKVREGVRRVLLGLVGPECEEEYDAVANALDAILALAAPSHIGNGGEGGAGSMLGEALEILRAVVWMEGRTDAQTYWFGRGRDFFAKYGETSNG